MGSKASPPPARLLIADDHPLIRESTQDILAREPDLEVVGEAGNGQEALELCLELHPDLVLMDVRMPEMDGLTATRAIKEKSPTTRVVVVTAYESEEYFSEAMRAGAAGYILKDATNQELLDAIRGVLSD